ncbi:hypothetical protein [Pseudalkalibacillus caeni]|uniref:Uncharacterized protein n=1 Tax=Exobacillus caeni TaxID=2574798 RepID=A0A5R9EZ51_9BACL|nr:hypothetical protein [Pseudalkalibacillus caeni]TLS35360.1 hypothetical protein FCL54_20965 [Pseudalkalibacillus caeni]
MEDKLKQLKQEMDAYISPNKTFTDFDKHKIQKRIQNLSTENQKPKRSFIFPKAVSAVVFAVLFLVVGGIAANEMNLFQNEQSTESSDNASLNNESSIAMDQAGESSEDNATMKATDTEQLPASETAKQFLEGKGFEDPVYINTTEEYVVTKDKLTQEPWMKPWGLMEIAKPTVYLDQDVTVERFTVNSHPLEERFGKITVDVYVINGDAVGGIINDKEMYSMEGKTISEIYKTQGYEEWKASWIESIEADKPYSLKTETEATEPPLDDRLKGIYDAIAADQSQKHLQGLVPAEVIKLYFYAKDQNNFDVFYALYSQSGKYGEPVKSRITEEFEAESEIDPTRIEKYVTLQRSENIVQIEIFQDAMGGSFKTLVKENGIWLLPPELDNVIKH